MRECVCACMRVYVCAQVSESVAVCSAMGWLLSVGSIKLYVSFAEYPLFYMALRIFSLFHGSFAKETYNIIDPTDSSHPIAEQTATLSLTCAHSYTRIQAHTHSRILSLFISSSLSLTHTHSNEGERCGVATISRLLKIIGLFCKRVL